MSTVHLDLVYVNRNHAGITPPVIVEYQDNLELFRLLASHKPVGFDSTLVRVMKQDGPYKVVNPLVIAMLNSLSQQMVALITNWSVRSAADVVIPDHKRYMHRLTECTKAIKFIQTAIKWSESPGKPYLFISVRVM